MSDSAWVSLAHIVRPQGRKGEVIAEILTDFPEKFAERNRVFLLPPEPQDTSFLREITLEEFRLHQGRLALKFAGIDSIEDADKLRGLDVVIPAEERAALEEDSVYISDLIGCEVFDSSAPAQPRLIGKIVDVDRGSTNTDLLVIQPESEEAALIEVPFVKVFLDNIDLLHRRLHMRLPEGLLELNAPPKKPQREKGRKSR